MPNNNFFLGGNDPLLGGNPMTQQHQWDYNQQIAQLEAAKQQLVQQQQQGHTPMSKSPLWDEIDRETDTLTSTELAAVQEDPAYVESSEYVQSLLNKEFMKIMRPIVENTPTGREALEKHLSIVRRLRKEAAEEVGRNMELFKEYTQNHADMTYAEFLKSKKPKQR